MNMGKTLDSSDPLRGLADCLIARIDSLFPANIGEGCPSALRCARLVVLLSWTLIVLASFYAVVLFFMHSPLAATTLASSAGLLVAVPFVLRYTKSCFVAGNLLTAIFFAALTFVALRLGGHGAESLPWYAGVPVVALITAGRRSAVFWFAVVVLSLTTLYFAEYRGYSAPDDLDADEHILLGLLSRVGLIVMVLSLGVLYNVTNIQMLRQMRESKAALEAERQQMLSMFGSMDEIIYVADPESYELLYVNGPVRQQWGDGLGQPCYRVLQDRDTPCPFCTNGHIFGDNVGRAHVWEFRNPVSERWYRCVDRAIRWSDGRLVRFELAIDIHERKEAEDTLRQAHAEAHRARQNAENARDELAAAQRQLLSASHSAGMAEVAVGVLHNGGHVIKSVNDSAALVSDKVGKAQAQSLARVVELLDTHADNLGAFITEDERGQHLPRFLAALAESLANDQAATLNELELLTRNIDHIKTIVSTQQSYAGVAGVVESVSLTDLVEDALRLNATSFQQLDIRVQRDLAVLPSIEINKQRVLQILINLIRNAKHAVAERKEGEKWVQVRTAVSDEDRVLIEVSDNGIGIAPENMTQIFSHGFTTKSARGGRGFGLHHSALSAQEMDGSLTVHSDGLGKGATFTITLPLRTAVAKP